MTLNLCDPKTIKQVMDMFGLSFRKEFGQNFLTDNMTVEDIADSCIRDGVDPDEVTILEIGPGIGCMTRELAKRYRQVIAIEIDSGLIPLLSYTLEEYDNVKVINADVMKVDLEEILAPYFATGKVCVCANLPYYITTPILMRMIESGLPFDSITVMVQLEVADRLCAGAGKKNCGAITATVDYYGQAQRLFVVRADKFMPVPKVDSATLRIDLYRDRPVMPKDEQLFFDTIRHAFEHRRKTLVNALSAGFSNIDKEKIAKTIADCGFSPDIRGERLTVEDFARLSDKLMEVMP